jgi:tRNA-dihydrouridine synthase A
MSGSMAGGSGGAGAAAGGVSSPWRLSVAPMMDWTDRHCRFFHRLLTRHTRLYTEMVTTGALLHGDVPRHLDFNPEEHPVALQLGGSEPADLAACAVLAQRWGYDEVNLNCGCPSERVQRGAFGACLMAEPELVGDCVDAMRQACTLPVTVKHRIGIDREERYGFVRDFVGTVHRRGGCTVFIVHARNAWLQGLSPKANREVPPLRYAVVAQLRCDFPGLTFVVNGGIADQPPAGPAGAHAAGGGAIEARLAEADGVMIGRDAYHHPWHLASWDRRFFGDPAAPPERAAVEEALVAYMARQAARGTPWPRIARHAMGLWHGVPGARRWRQVWSDPGLRDLPPAEVSRRAQAAMARAAADAADAPLAAG